ncbi:MAG: response regulator [Acidobacteriota bacterium]
MKVLVIDDEPDIRMVAQVGLTAAGIDVVMATGGLEGVLRAREEQPDVIVLDVMMPGMDGYATLAALRKDPDTANIPVVLLTAKTLSDTDGKLRGQGVVDILTKPFLPRQLAERIARIKGSA